MSAEKHIMTIEKLHQTWSTENRLKLKEIYQSLSFEEGKELVSYSIALLDQDKERLAEDILLHLSCFIPSALHEAHQSLIDRMVLYPWILFRGAKAHISEQLAAKSIGSEQANEFLLALAWIGDATVQKNFLEWTSDTPSWAVDLYVSPKVYAQEGGWFLTDEGQRQNLYISDCYALIQSDDEVAHQSNPVKVTELNASQCQWCNRKLTTLFNFDLSDSRLDLLQVKGTRLQIVTCDVCTNYNSVYTKVDWEGNATWHPQNKKPEYLPDEDEIANIETLPSERFVLSSSLRDPFMGIHQDIPISHSQIGGYPTWYQDAEYPTCLECNQLMKFIGQLDQGDIEEFGEGVIYAFLCNSCQVACTGYQQT